MLPRLLASLVSATLVASSAMALTSQTTEPVGFMRYSVSAGLQTIGFPLLDAPLASGRVASVDGNRLFVDCPVADVTAGLQGNAAYYLEFTAGPVGTDATLVGERLELDVDRMQQPGAAANALVVQPGSARGTLPVLPAELAGYAFVIRAHFTLAGVFGTGNAGALSSGATTATGDQVHVLENGGFQTYLFHADAATGGKHWVKFPEGTAADTLPIAPGTGLFLRRMSDSATTIRHVGSVRTHAFVQPLAAGYTLASEPFPVESSFASRGMTEGNGFAAGAQADTADRVFVWTGAAYRALYYAASADAAPSWRSADTTTQSVANENDSAFSPFHAVLIQKLVMDSAYVVPAPL